uniref:EB domain-containing protein n=1 Tax=Salix viminalis TaxID=40686 RepID=A0A6N2MT95_SALVM
MGKSSIKLAFLVVLIFAAVMTFSAAVSRADGTVFLPCKSDSDCQAIECAEGAAVCVNNNCHCDSKVESILASDCKHDEDCVKFP